MAETIDIPARKRFAVVTGANKGIGLEICRQLASNGGVMVVLTARDEKRGLEAVENLKESGHSDVIFHQLDVQDAASVASLESFIRTQFGKLDILVNNAGIAGAIIDGDTLMALILGDVGKKMEETYELAEECLNTNYYGTKRVTEALIPLLQLSNSARIVNVSSSSGKLKNIHNEWAKEMLSNVDGLTEERVDEVLKEFMKDFKKCLIEPKGWPYYMSAYSMSKAAMNAYTRILTKKFPNFGINCVCPGFVKTDGNCNTGFLTVEEGAEGPVKLALSPDGGLSGQFYFRTEISNFDSE